MHPRKFCIITFGEWEVVKQLLQLPWRNGLQEKQVTLQVLFSIFSDCRRSLDTTKWKRATISGGVKNLISVNALKGGEVLKKEFYHEEKMGGNENVAVGSFMPIIWNTFALCWWCCFSVTIAIVSRYSWEKKKNLCLMYYFPMDIFYVFMKCVETKVMQRTFKRNNWLE